MQTFLKKIQSTMLNQMLFKQLVFIWLVQLFFGFFRLNHGKRFEKIMRRVGICINMLIILLATFILLNKEPIDIYVVTVFDCLRIGLSTIIAFAAITMHIFWTDKGTIKVTLLNEI